MNLLIFQEPVYTEAKKPMSPWRARRKPKKREFLKIKNKKGDGKIK